MSQADPSTVGRSPAARQPFPWRRLAQYRLRTLLIFMAVCAVLFALLGWWSHKARQQRASVAAIRARGGGVRYDFEMTSRLPPHWPKWLVDALGVEGNKRK